MNFLRTTLTTGQALVLGVVIVGCATAATITGHLTGTELLTALGLVGGGAAGVTGAHVGATNTVNALTGSTGLISAAQSGTAQPGPAAVASPPAGPAPVDGPPTMPAPVPGPASTGGVV